MRRSEAVRDDLITRLSLKLAAEASGRLNVLFIEDDKRDYPLVRAPFKQIGARVNIRWGKTAIQYSKRYEPDVIIADITGPGNINGFKALEEIQKESKSVPTIVYSRRISNDGECRATAKSYGVRYDYFLRKGVTSEKELLDTTQSAIRNAYQEALERMLTDEFVERCVPSEVEERVLGRHYGVVESIKEDFAKIVFEDRGSKFVVAFPAWRLIRAKADYLNAAIEHVILDAGIRISSELNLCEENSPKPPEVRQVKDLPEELLERLSKHEES